VRGDWYKAAQGEFDSGTVKGERPALSKHLARRRGERRRNGVARPYRPVAP